MILASVWILPESRCLPLLTTEGYLDLPTRTVTDLSHH